MTEVFKLDAEDGITPDAWVIIEITEPAGQYQKILSGWSGSYLYGDSWRMSSPMKKLDIKIDEDFFIIETGSGSTYKLFKDRQGLRMSNAGIYNQLKEKFGDRVNIVEL